MKQERNLVHHCMIVNFVIFFFHLSSLYYIFYYIYRNSFEDSGVDVNSPIKPSQNPIVQGLLYSLQS